MKVYYDKDGIKHEILKKSEENFILKNEKGEEMFLKVSLGLSPEGKVYDPGMITTELFKVFEE